MLDRDFILNNIELIKETLKHKNIELNLNELIETINSRRKFIKEADILRNQKNKLSNSISELRRRGENISSLLEESKNISQQLKTIQNQLKEIEDKENDLIKWIPNIPHKSIPKEEFKIIKQKGNFEKRGFTYDKIMSQELDFSGGAKITGSHFVLYRGLAAYLERILINFMLDIHIHKNGYTEVLTPFIVNEHTLFSTGQLPKLKDDMYCIEQDNFYLIPTAEPPITSILKNQILKVNELPIKYVGYSPCFRREAGSYGKETRGLKRIHQFNKVEMVRFVKPEESYQHLEEMVKNATMILDLLDLDYRVILLPVNDLSFASAMTYDIEVWAPGLGEFLEVSSVSNFESFQARRANIRYKTQNGKNEYIHTLNGSGLATPRLFISLIEKHQKDGIFNMPEILNDYISKGINLIHSL